MGASRSSFQRKGSSAPYNIYVTNKTDGIKHLYVRLRDDKLGDTETYRRLTGSRPTGTAERSLKKQRKERLFPTLTQAGFCLLQPGIPKRFSVMSRASSPMYVSVHDGYDLWVTDMLVDATEYGCVAILGGKNGINIQSSNPSPLWTPHTQGDPVPEQAMQANKVNSSRQLYFGRSQGKLCFVETKDGRLDFWRAMFDEYTKQLKGDLLMDTGFDVIEARRGDKLPPNTLQVGGGYVGRYIGDYLCPINIHDGKVWDFQSIFKISTKKGDIVVMTNDPLL